ncbi:MAG: MobA/MobL family protein [Hydrogenophaga sp.]|uniref:MobA/MobL family protein n=1 Tax=Hydrogenophaga sp. TaxID=1904254 RepID=UPI0040370526
MASFHHHVKSGKKGTAASHAAYISRQGRHKRRTDLVLSGHGNMPPWASEDPKAFWDASDEYERKNAAAFREHEIALPKELAREQLPELVGDLVSALIGEKPYQFAVHAPTSALEGKENVHLHLMYSDRAEDGIERTPAQTFKRYNAKDPELGGRRKDSGGKNRLHLRDEMIATRRKCAEVQNLILEKYGHESRVDHRTLKQQGIPRSAENHLGRATIKKMTDEDKQVYLLRRR